MTAREAISRRDRPVVSRPAAAVEIPAGPSSGASVQYAFGAVNGALMTPWCVGRARPPRNDRST
jgi:hypothetical protein